MQVFKTGSRIILRHAAYLVTYVGILSVLGIFMAISLPLGGSDQNSFSSHETKFSVIDRDGSAFTRGLCDFLSQQGSQVYLEDSEIALQDAVAKGHSAYILIIPKGFGGSFTHAANAGSEPPLLETAYSYYSTEGRLMDQKVNEYLGIARAYAGLEKTTAQDDIVQHTDATMAQTASIDTVDFGGSASEALRYVFFLRWSTYALFTSIIVCVTVLMSSFNRTDVRRRNLVSPTNPLSYSLQVAASSLLIMVGTWLWTTVLGLAVFGEGAAMISGPGLALIIAATFVFATVPLSVGYLLGQLGIGEFASNAIGNIMGMVVSFLGGAWVSYDLFDPSVQALAHFSPAFWYVNVLQSATDLTAVSPETLAPIMTSLGMIALFTVAIFAVALVVGRLRVQSVEAGGNAGAARTTRG